MECLVKEMQDTETGVPVRSQKLFLTSIPSAFMGYDLIEWLMERLSIEESEALSISNQLCLHGYFFPVNDSKMLVVKDDSSLYRFQTPYYWPWQHKAPDNVEYAIYLAKRSLRNKQRHGLEDYETEALANLHKNLKGKWDFITMQAEEQVKLAKERKKGDKIVGDSQERAYWRVHRPPPGQFTPLEPCPVPSRDRQGKPRGRKVEDWQREVDFLTTSLGRTRMKMSQACECLVTYCETFSDYDPMLQQPIPNNPWVSDDPTFWQLNSTIVDVPTEKRVRRWAISIEEIVSDPTGRLEFTAYLKKEYSHENIRFWLAVNDLRRSAHSMIPHKVKEIYEEFLAPGAPCEINIDGKTMENVQQGLKNPSRFAFDSAAEHIYALLLKKDCYPRFIRSDHYKALLATGIQKSHKKGFFRFPGKKKSTTTAPNPASLTQTSGSGSTSAQGNLTRRRGSDRSLSGSAHELAVSGVKDGTKVPHSHSQSNLSDIPYRGDMPTGALPIHMENPIVPSSTSGGSNDASYHNIQEASRSFNEPLETTLEVSGGGACSVCPWETIDESVATSKQVAHNVSVSVCPWEEETLPTTSNTKSNVLHTTSSDSKLIKINLEHADDLSEKMKRSCGLRQNTLDDYQSNKRLATVVEQRRASVTVAPKLSDFQFNQRRPRNIDLKSTHQPDATLLPSFGTPKQPVVSQSSLPLARAVSFEGRDVEICTTSSPAHQSIIITEETPPSTSAVASSSSNMGAIPKSIRCNNQNKSNANNINLINKSNESLTKSQNNQNLENESEEKQKTPKLSSSSVNVNVVETKCELNNDEKQTINEKIKSRSSSEAIDEETTVDLDDDRDDVKVLSSSKNNSSANLVMHIAGTDPDLSKLTCSTPTPSRNTPPIIHVVTCPTIQIDSKEAPDDEDDELPFTSTSVEPNESDHPRVVFTQESIESEIQVTIDPPPPSQKDDDSDLNVKNQVDEDKDSGQLGKKLDVESKIKFIIDDEESGMHEDLSPTAEEYQECMAFQQSSESDYYDIATGGGNLAPGCVAPAPTPAPSIAPLAEVEIDPADDEIDAESKDSGDAKLDENSKKKRKKKLHEKTDSQEKATTSTDEATKSSSNEQQNRFAVCPWEDEDVTSTVDQPFVKTYSTLGYL